MSGSNSNATQILERVLTSKDLPTLPFIAAKLLELTALPEVALTDITDLISQDMALSTKVLRVANSALFSFPNQISSIKQAVSILGLNAVRSLVLSFSLLSFSSTPKSSSFDLEHFWERSLIEAAAARLIFEQVADTDSEEVFTCGLLQNIGQLVLAITLPQEYDQVLGRIAEGSGQAASHADCTAIERDILGMSHPEVGYAVAKNWEFPENLLLPIKYHHDPCSFTGTFLRHQQIIRATYLADLLAELFYSDSPEHYHKRFRNEAKQLLGLKVLGVNTVLHMIDKVVDQSAQYFYIKIKSIKSVPEILQEANLRLSLINLSYEEMNRELIKSKMELEKLTEDLARKNQLLENLANIDGLTEINNHRFFQDFLDSEINRCLRNDRPLSLLLADIDHFKKFNDTYGHQTGDFILKEFCRISKDIIREYDLIARYGGEEFAFVLPETDQEEALLVAEKIRQTTENYLFDDKTNSYRVTISVGVASAFPARREFTKDQFIGLADEALYEAKHSGRNRVSLANSKRKKRWLAF
ncbi:MAG: GGDEF domain-containing protein [Proteobacteria bacterium]|nr:GGDEF domain-containing protein [Pseudomonadota bacterium]